MTPKPPLTALAPQTQTLGEQWDALLRQFAHERPGFWRETIGQEGTPQPVYNWGLGVALTAEIAVASLDVSRLPRLQAALTMSDSYWNPDGPVPGFDVLPSPRERTDRYYDDNAWMVLAFVEAYELTKDPQCLTRASRTLDYVLSGLDDAMGGGIYWRESDRASKNTCSNGPSAAACLALFKHTGDHQLVDLATSIYDWTREHLRDPSDGLYWDHLTLDGHLDTTKWTYNTALMLRTAKQLFAVTGEQRFADDAAEMQASSISRWIQPDGQIPDHLQFAHLLFENLDPDAFDAAQCISRLLATRNEQGWFGLSWGSPGEPTAHMLQQASGIRALAVYEHWQRRSRASLA